MFEGTRRNAGFALLGALALPTLLSAKATTPDAKPAKSYELTFLKAQGGNTAALVKFIALNWFEMDRIAVEQGIMTDYRMMTSNEADQPWDVLVIIGYPGEGGYQNIATEFEKIRAAHKTVLVEGKTLRQLGSIVSSRRLFPS